jgi:phthalate 4,5-dioxygenase
MPPITTEPNPSTAEPVSLFFGRNEECGLRCVYHGWKFDVAGRCVDMMNEPEALNFTNKIRATAYPTVEVGGIIWAYMGPPERQPPLPKFSWTQVPETHRHVTKVIQECNWLQGLLPMGAFDFSSRFR